MAVFEDSEFIARRQPSLLSIASYRLVDSIDQRAIALRRYIIRTRTERALSSLSNRQLLDIGIDRSEIAAFSEKSAQRWGG